MNNRLQQLEYELSVLDQKRDQLIEEIENIQYRIRLDNGFPIIVEQRWLPNMLKDFEDMNLVHRKAYIKTYKGMECCNGQYYFYEGITSLGENYELDSFPEYFAYGKIYSDYFDLEVTDSQFGNGEGHRGYRKVAEVWKDQNPENMTDLELLFSSYAALYPKCIDEEDGCQNAIVTFDRIDGEYVVNNYADLDPNTKWEL